MIAVAASIVGGFIAGIKTPLTSPIVYALKFKKDLFLISFFAYCLALGYEFKVSNVYNASTISILSVILPSILLLDAGLKGECRDLLSYIIVTFILAGLLVNELFVIATIAAIYHQFSRDHPRSGVLIVSFSVALLILGLIFCERFLNLPGGSLTQIAFISAILIAIVFWKIVI